MTQTANPLELVACAADERRLAEQIANLPASIGRPPTGPPSRTRGRILGAGAALTRTTLIAGIALTVLGAIDAVWSGRLRDVAALALGLALIGTHCEWLAFAKAIADTINARRHREVVAARQKWLQTIRPYARYEVTTRVGADASISIIRVCHRPIRSSDRTFTFVREIARCEIHSGDAPAAVVAERAELLRRQAAVDTKQEHDRFEIAASAHESALLAQSDETQRLAARRAASQALSEQINSNLRSPPRIEEEA